MFFQKLYNTNNFSSSHSQSKRPSIANNRCLSPVGTDPSMYLFQPPTLPASNKSLTLSFSRSNRSRRSFRGKQCKENKESIGDINSSTSIKFKGHPPKKRNNPSKFYDPRQQLFVDQLQGCNSLSPSKRLLAQKQRIPAIKDFQLLRKLGEGSFSKVFQVVQSKTGVIYALKIMQKQGLCELQVIDRLASQLKIQSFCNHVNIVKLQGVFDDPQRIYLIQQYAGLKTLYSLMQQRKSGFTLKQVQGIVRQICQAVLFLHRNSIIHRDIKPENILVAPGGLIKLTDFGWSVYNPSKELRGTFCGTPLYLSPELISAEKYDETVDLWAVGVLTFELITGSLPFGIKCVQDLKNIVTQAAHLSEVGDPSARDFIQLLLTKQIHKRQDIFYMCEHQFLKQ